MQNALVRQSAAAPDMDALSHTYRAAFTIWGVAAMLLAPGIAMASGLISHRLVHIFLCDAYLPAIPAIRIYMVGDMLRVWTLIAMYSAFARGQPVRYALIEMAALTLMLMLVPLLSPVAGAKAPYLAYTASFAIMAVAMACAWLRDGSPVTRAHDPARAEHAARTDPPLPHADSPRG